MRQYVPSEVVAYIDKAMPFIKDGVGPRDIPAHRDIRGLLLGLAEIADRVPEHLIIDNDALTDIITSGQAIRTVVREAEGQDLRVQHVVDPPALRPTDPKQPNPVILIRRAFARCPDAAPGPHIPRLAFISDDALRRSLETDLDAVDRALAGSEWKAATVIGGSLVEALLLWAVQEKKPPAEVQAAVAQLVQAGSIKRNPGTDPETWHLQDYISVARELNLIREETAAQARLLTGFRNLIHPGRAARTGQVCNRGTAHAAQAAVAFVIEDLK